MSVYYGIELPGSNRSAAQALGNIMSGPLLRIRDRLGWCLRREKRAKRNPLFAPLVTRQVGREKCPTPQTIRDNRILVGTHLLIVLENMDDHSSLILTSNCYSVAGYFTTQPEGHAPVNDLLISNRSRIDADV